ncbi:MAG: hypothetical protein EP312_10825 [Gammaproteobacteria bacterium]|nr:MAG: hypothetical protein EP312_10825 [Gammaproteobacteria bacterium]
MKQWITGVVLFLGAIGAVQANESTVFPAALQSLVSHPAYGTTYGQEPLVSEQTLAAVEAAWDVTVDLFDNRVSVELVERIPNPIQ